MPTVASRMCRRSGASTCPKLSFWGCEVRGRAGRAGAARSKRAALAALTLGVAFCGAVTVDLLRKLLGLWTDVLLYRDAFALIGAWYRFVEQHKEDPQHRVRSVPGPVGAAAHRQFGAAARRELAGRRIQHSQGDGFIARRSLRCGRGRSGCGGERVVAASTLPRPVLRP